MRYLILPLLFFLQAACCGQSTGPLSDDSTSAKQIQDVIVNAPHPPGLEMMESITLEKKEVITVPDFQRHSVNNVFDALTYVPGVYCDIDQGLTNPVDININGLEGNYTMFCIDGVPAMNNLAGIFALSAFPLAGIDHISTIAGSNSLNFGSDAMAGVIDIVTRDPVAAPSLALEAQLNSKLENSLGLTAAIHLKKVHALFAVSANNMNYRWDINHDNFIDMPLVNQASLYNKWSFVRKENRVAIIYARYLFEDRFTGQMNTPGRLKGSDQYYTQWLQTNQWQTGFKYQLPTHENIMLFGDYSEHYQLALFDTTHYHGVLRNAYAKLNWTKRLQKHRITAGVDYRLKYYSDNTGLSDKTLTGISPTVHTTGIFVQDEIQLNGQNALAFGARFDYNTASGPIATPRFSYEWNSKDRKNIIQLTLGTGYRVPNVLNEGFTALETSRQVLVPQKLKTEYSVSMNLDYTRTQSFNMGALKFEGGIFGIYLVNFVEPDYASDSAAVIYNNSQGGGSFGAHAGIDWSFKFPLRLGFNCTYAFAFELDKDGGDGDVEIDIPTHSPPFTSNFTAAYTFNKPQITIDLTGNIISPMLLATVPNDFRPGQSPWFSIINIQMTKKFGHGFELFGGIKNLLNFITQNPILRPYDPFNRYLATNNPYNYHFDTTYAYAGIEGVKGFIGFRYTLQ